VVVLGFNSSDDADLAREFMEECNFPFRTVLDSSDEARDVAYTGYKASCVPLHYIIDREGKIALAQPGFESGYKKILGTLARLGVDTGVEPLPVPDAVRTERRGERAIPSVGAPVRGKAVIQGRLTGSDGKPVPAASIRLRCEDPPIRKAGETDGEGTFKFRRLPAGAYTLTWERDPRDPSRDVEKEITLEEEQSLEIELSETK
jgi:hypothetical protein